MTPAMEEYAEQDIAKRLATGCFHETSMAEVKVVNPILVIDQNDKMRRCDDARYSNAYQASPSFAMPQVKRDVPAVVQPGSVQITYDLADAYYQVPLAQAISSTALYGF